MTDKDLPEPLITYLDDMGRPTHDKAKAKFISEQTMTGITIRPIEGDTAEDT